MRYLMTLTFYLILQNSAFPAPVKDFIATYDLYHNEIYVGQSTRKLTSDNNNLIFTSTAKTAGIAAWFYNITITETSKLRLENEQLKFNAYSYNEQKNSKNEHYQLRINPAQKLYNTYTEKYYPIAKNLHDTLGFTVAIMHDLLAGKREIKYTIAEKKKLKKYTLKLIKKEKLATNNGEISTLKMEHYNPETKRRFTFWCAEKLGFLPVRILNINHKGDENLLNLTQLNQKTISLALEDENID